MMVGIYPDPCYRGHSAKVVKADLPKGYGLNGTFWQVKCSVKGCCFGDYFKSKQNAVTEWNKYHGDLNDK